MILMITERVISGEKIYLRQIALDDCNDTYVNWLNDPEVNQYLETRFCVQTLDKIYEFVESQRNNNHSVLFAIISQDNNKHIGNIKIGPINTYHNRADISYFIGEKSLWGGGIATEAIGLICEYGFKVLNLHRIEAGAYELAIGSRKALEKNGFKEEGYFRKHVLYGEKYIGCFHYGLIKDDWVKTIERI